MRARIARLARAAALPLLMGGCVIYRHYPPQGELTPAQRRWSDSVSTVREAELAAILTGDRNQRRTRLSRNAVLDSLARARAWDMALRGYFSHVNSDSVGPNTLVRRAGFALPADYDARMAGNDVESAAAGYASARTAWRLWMRSPLHRSHLLGLDARAVAQTEFGIGYAWRPESRYGHYWVVLIARPRGMEAEN